MSALSEQAQHFLDTAFKLALHDEFMGGPTAEERQRIEAIRAELATQAAQLDRLRAELAKQKIVAKLHWEVGVALGADCDQLSAELDSLRAELAEARRPLQVLTEQHVVVDWDSVAPTQAHEGDEATDVK